ncbi:MAG: hypothetical protein OXC37_02410 [Bdellovibrionaceae bacterium]|nr:hypothetical protein [Pseudobdellovibrionaceae bacterium]
MKNKVFLILAIIPLFLNTFFTEIKAETINWNVNLQERIYQLSIDIYFKSINPNKLNWHTGVISLQNALFVVQAEDQMKILKEILYKTKGLNFDIIETYIKNLTKKGLEFTLLNIDSQTLAYIAQTSEGESLLISLNEFLRKPEKFEVSLENISEISKELKIQQTVFKRSKEINSDLLQFRIYELAKERYFKSITQDIWNPFIKELMFGLRHPPALIFSSDTETKLLEEALLIVESKYQRKLLDEIIYETTKFYERKNTDLDIKDHIKNLENKGLKIITETEKAKEDKCMPSFIS